VARHGLVQRLAVPPGPLGRRWIFRTWALPAAAADEVIK